MHAVGVAKEMGVEHHVVQYMKAGERPSRETLADIASMLEGPVEDMVRKDKRFAELGLQADDYVGNTEAVLALLDTHIELLQRPILVKGRRAIVGRPKERVGDFLA